MTYSDAGNFAATIAMKVLLMTERVLPTLNGHCSINEYSENQGTFELYLRANNEKSAFTKVEINVSQYSDENIAIQVTADLTSFEYGEESSMDISVDAIMEKYGHLKPIVREGIIHRMADRILDKPGTKRVATSSFTMRFGCFDRLYQMEKDPPDFGIDEDEIAEASVPYLQSLYEIHRDIMKGRRQGGDADKGGA